jgi:hypothetical protein
MMQFSKTAVLPFTWLELFRHGLKSMKVNFNIFPGQVCETRVRNRFPPPTSLLEDVLEEWYKIPLETYRLVQVHYKQDCSCIEGKRSSNTILIKKCVQYL